LRATLRERLHELGMEVRSMIWWDDYNEGFFCGAGCSGYDLHVDSTPTSNIGSVFAGHKLLALWRFPEDSQAVIRKHGRAHFASPLTRGQIESLEVSCAVALAPPGSLYVFSGATAHTVCNVGFGVPGPRGEAPSPSLIVSSYESFINLHPQHLQMMLASCMGQGGKEGSDSDDEEIREFCDEVSDELEDLQKRLFHIQGSMPQLAGHVQNALNYLRKLGPAARIKVPLPEGSESTSHLDQDDGSPSKRAKICRLANATSTSA